MIDEREYEQRVINIFKNNNYTYLKRDEMLKKRGGLGTIICFDELEESIKRINEGINKSDLHAVIDKVKRMDDANLLIGNKRAVKALIEGIKVYNSKTEKTNTYKLIDFKNKTNNSYIVTNQLVMYTNHIDYEKQIPDIVVYVNGLPVSVIELKSPELEETKSTEDAFDQLKNYQNNMPTLFTWNIINAVSNMYINRYGSLTASYTRFSNWRNLENKEDETEPYKYFFSNLYKIDTLLTLLKDFTFYTSGDNLTKIVAGYHQFSGVIKTANSVICAMNHKTYKGGVFWHTQGTGKSLSMVFLTRLVNNSKKKMTTILVTDRKDLDNQLSENFLNAKDFLGQQVKQIKSITNLIETLKERNQNGVFLCTIQKFDENVKQLSDREDILIISDEAHRSHKNIQGRLDVVEDEFSIKEKFGYAYYLRRAFPNATFVGFTGTPIETDDYQTKDIFGKYSTKYLMTDATKDGFIVPISYESRYAKLLIASEKKQELDNLYNNIKKEILKNTDLKLEIQKNINKKLQKMDLIIGDPGRIKEIAKDFVIHYKQRQNLLKGKAIFVAFNRDIAFRYYKEITIIAPELKKNIRLIATPNKQKDSSEMLALIGTDDFRKKSADIFKNPDSKFKIAIVVDMWLTGFDAPSLDTIYFDKPIKMHNLMQAIARVNRTYTDKKNKNLVKQNGLVVDYIGLWKKLEDALLFYTTGGDVIDVDAPENIEKTKEELLLYVNNIYKKYLRNEVDLNIKNFSNKEYLFDVIEKIQNIVIKYKIKQQFVSDTKKIIKGLTSVITICSEEEKIKIQLLIVARSMLIKRELGKIDIDFKIAEIKKMIADSIIYNKTIINDKIEGKSISLIDVINSLIEIQNNLELTSLEADKKLKATQYIIKKLRAFNIVKSEKLTEKLQSLLNTYDSNHISIEEFILGLREIAIEVKNAKEEFENSDEDSIEIAFYEIMLDDEYNKQVYDKQKIKEITDKLYVKIKPLLKKSWLYNDTTKRTVRSEMIKLLIANNYPPSDRERIKDKLIIQLEEQINIGLCKLEEE